MPEIDDTKWYASRGGNATAMERAGKLPGDRKKMAAASANARGSSG